MGYTDITEVGNCNDLMKELVKKKYTHLILDVILSDGSTLEIIPNIAVNQRNNTESDDIFIDELLYKERYSIERTNAWLDSLRTILNRFDVTDSSWSNFNIIACIIVLLRKINRKQKSR